MRCSDGGMETLSVAVDEYMTNGVGKERKLDPDTGHAVMRL